MRTITSTIAALFVGVPAVPAAAEVVSTGDDSFVTRAEAVVEADPKQTWLALISPSRWWSSDHTWSGDAANLSLMPQAGGCFCERIPEVEDAERITLEGSVEHMRVIQAYPEVALRMDGALGPLQSEPVTGILTIAISEVDAGTRIVWEYNVGGSMRYPVATISEAVDGVMSLQLSGLAELLGPVVEVAAEESLDEETPLEESAETAEDAPNEDASDELGEDAVSAGSTDGDTAVDAAFEDLSDS